VGFSRGPVQLAPAESQPRSVPLSDGLSGPLLGIAPDDTADSMTLLLACTFQHDDHAVPWHPEQLASKMASMFV
jgi:hypothetical protein